VTGPGFPGVALAPPPWWRPAQWLAVAAADIVLRWRAAWLAVLDAALFTAPDCLRWRVRARAGKDTT
jgi:hypothetical protein